MRQTKSCGCLIATAVIDLEKTRRKNKLMIKEIREKLKNTKDIRKITKLKAEKREIMIALKETMGHKKKMKNRFHNYIKKSGYAPPKLKRD